MAVLNKIASSLNRKDQEVNKQLAQQIAKNADQGSIEELILLLQHKSKSIQHDCIKVLYEVGELDPALIRPHLTTFLDLLDSKNNRLQWGAMTAISYISSIEQKITYCNLDKIIQATEKGSVITRDGAVNVLINLMKNPKYTGDVFILLLEQLRSCPINQLPMYAQRAATVITEKNIERFTSTLNNRMGEIEKESKQKRLIKVLTKLNKKKTPS